MEIDTICPYCIEEKPSYDLARSVLRFDHKSEKLIHNFKYYDKTEAAKTLSNMMIKAYGDKMNEIDVISSIPMHKSKLRRRKYNQAAVLANEISKICNKTYTPELLIKTKDSVSQSGLSKEERKENVKNTFKLNPILKNSIWRKNVLIVDDVLTTGATASECAKVLRRNGAKRINILTIARTY
jgi:ComF family protein